MVVGDESRDGGKEACRGGDECFGDAGSDGAEAGATSGAESGESINDAPDGAKKADEGRDACSGGEPGHTLFDAANFFGGSELHADGNRLQGFESLRRGIAGAGDLALEFAVAGRVDVGKRRAGGNETLGIGDSLCGAEDF